MKGKIIAVPLLLAVVSCQSERTDSPAVFAGIVEESAETQPADLDEIQWLTGYWTGEDGGTRMEEIWLPRRGNLMVGLHLDHFPSGRTFFEYLRIEQEGNSVIFFASPRGRIATAFIATSVRDSSVTFENAEHDYPQRIEYALDNEGRLHARISGDVDGTEESTEWIWHRSDLPRP
jgi:hypothetical protein